jgi:hypothetical protein
MNEKTMQRFATLNLPESDKVATDGTVDLSVLDAHRIYFEIPPEEPVTVVRLVGHRISTAGNLTVVAAQAKSGKTAVVGAMIAAVVAAEIVDTSAPSDVDLLGFTAAAAGGKAVVVFDTEQSRRDAWVLVNRVVARAKGNDLPSNFRFYSLADIETRMRRRFLSAELERAKSVCGGIHCVFVDGVADLCIDLNNTDEAFGLVDELIQLAIAYECPIVLVIHENPSAQDTGKTRGHLGSQLLRKAEASLRVLKGANGISTIYSDNCRNADIPKGHGARFVFDAVADMHVTVTTDAEKDKLEAKRKKCRTELDVVFTDSDATFKYAALVGRIMDMFRVGKRTAERRIKDWIDLGLIKNASGDYTRL